MKKMFLIGGTMGVGKTSIGHCLKMELDNSVFLDGDWCWNANPFQITNETTTMVMDNICYLLNNFIHCSAYENIIFCWVMHQQSILDTIINRIDSAECDIKIISLIASKETISERIMADVKNGIRTIDVLNRSMARIPLYQKHKSIKIETDGKSINEIVDEIKIL